MGILLLAINILIWLIIIDAILSWIPSIDRRNPFVMSLRRITEPLYRPVRSIIPPERTGYIDLAPIVLIIGLQIIAAIIVSLFR